MRQRYAIAKMQRRADTILRKASDLAAEINDAFGYESYISDAADDVVCTAESLSEALARLPSVLKAGGHA